MSERTDVLRRVRVASPCRASWDGMEGDERVRFCRQCGLNVYNLSEMTRAEAGSLVARTEGRLCARFYRRADGTVLTKDCPVGLRAVRLRVARAAGAAFAAVLGLFAAVSGKTLQKNSSCPAGDDLKVEDFEGHLPRVGLRRRHRPDVRGRPRSPCQPHEQGDGAKVYGAHLRRRRVSHRRSPAGHVHA